MSSTYSVSHYNEYQQTKNKNLFEEIVDQMMLDGINPVLHEKIKNLPLEDKRMAILAFLDKDRNLFMKIKSLISRENLSKMDYVKDVVRMLREYVKVGEVEKKKFGEVMTSLDLVKEMIKTLPDEVWSNPELKWLDPANGTGPFPIMVIYRLMVGLEKWQPDPNLRYKHIVENMIYTCELQAKNVFLWLCAVDPHDEYETNTYWGSFLEDGFDKHMKEVWGVEKFDVVLGNPPYNLNGGVGGGRGGESGIWKKFIYRSLTMSDNLIFVTPNLWLGNKKDFAKIKNISSISHINLNDCNKYFDVGVNFCFFLLTKKKANNCTLVTPFSTSKIDIDEFEFIPLSTIGDINTSKEILNKLFKFGKLKFTNGDNRSINTPLYTNGGDYLSFYSSDSSNGKKSLKCCEKIKGYGKLKLCSSYINDFDGDNVYHYTEINYDKGVGKQSGFFEIKNPDQGERLQSFLKSDIVIFINNNLRKGRYANSVLENIPLIDLDKNYDEFYQIFNLSDKDIEYIKRSTIKIVKS